MTAHMTHHHRRQATAWVTVVVTGLLAACTPGGEPFTPVDPTGDPSAIVTPDTSGEDYALDNDGIKVTEIDASDARTALSGHQYDVVHEYSSAPEEDFSPAQITADGEIIAFARDSASQPGTRDLGIVASDQYERLTNTDEHWGELPHDVSVVATFKSTTVWVEHTGERDQSASPWKMFVHNAQTTREIASSTNHTPDISAVTFGRITLSDSEGVLRVSVPFTGEVTPTDGSARRIDAFVLTATLTDPAQVDIVPLGPSPLPSLTHDHLWQVVTTTEPENSTTRLVVTHLNTASEHKETPASDTSTRTSQPTDVLTYKPGVRVHPELVTSGNIVALRVTQGTTHWIDLYNATSSSITRILVPTLPTSIDMCEGIIAWTSPAVDSPSSTVSIYSLNDSTLWATDVADNLGTIACRGDYLMWQAMDSTTETSSTAVVIRWKQ